MNDEADWRRPRLVENAVELLERQLTRKRDRIDVVHLCLTTDPFMVGHPEVTSLSLALIERLNGHGVRASVLTKGVLPAELADARYDRGNTVGISLVSLDEGFRRRFEPGAALYRERIAGLERLHAAGCRPLVHIEPYPTPNIVRQEVGPLLEAVAFVDELYFGGWTLLPAVHRVASLTKRWLLGTHQGSVDNAHLASYLNESVFRFNRRRSRSRGMVFYRVLEIAVAHAPVRYADLIVTKRPRVLPQVPPQAHGHPPSLDRPPANRPWRVAGLEHSG